MCIVSSSAEKVGPTAAESVRDRIRNRPANVGEVTDLLYCG